MFRSHLDHRHLPSLTTRPQFGNKMANYSQDGPVSAPCIPAEINFSITTKARLNNLVVPSQSMPLLVDVSRAQDEISVSRAQDEISVSRAPDEISAALGLTTDRLMDYEKPRPDALYEDLIPNLQYLKLNNSADNTLSMDTCSHILPLRNISGSLSCPGSRGNSISVVSSSVDSFSFWKTDSGKDLPNQIKRPRSAGPKRTLANVLSPQSPNPLSVPKITRHSQTCTSSPNYNKTKSSSNTSRGSPRDLVRALVSSARQEFPLKLPNPPHYEPRSMTELQYLVTYNLVNNFYYNLVSWSPQHNAVAIAIDSRAYWWDGSSQVHDMHIERPGLAPVTCVTCSSRDSVAVAYADGLLSIFGGRPESQISRHHERFGHQSPVSRQFASAVQCVQWFPEGSHLITGHQSGAVIILFYEGTSLTEKCRLHGFSQQICGIALSRDCGQVAVGANENLAIVWDLGASFFGKSSNSEILPKLPQETCRLRHASAVKGISFCPWAPHLLATGGGSNDRHLRFWHTRSGTLLGEINTQRQITAVFWSSSYKQVLVTYGYSGSNTTEDHPQDTVVAAIYEYPEARVVAEAHAREPLRALSATISPDETKVAIAANDGTVRVFGLWKRRPYSLTAAPTQVIVGSFRSAIVESVEGVDFRAHIFR